MLQLHISAAHTFAIFKSEDVKSHIHKHLSCLKGAGADVLSINDKLEKFSKEY